MKKFLGIGLAGVVLTSLLAGGACTFADTFTGVDGGSFPVRGEIGMDPESLDPTDPNAPKAGDKFWVKAEMPTSAIFRTTGVKPEITSPSYTIKNHSNYPVKIELQEFTKYDGNATNIADIAKVDSLNLVTTKGETTGSYALVEKGVQNGKQYKYKTDKTTLVQRLAAGGLIPAKVDTSKDKDKKDFTGSKEWNFNFSGQASGDLKINTILENKFVFGFTALDAAGDVVVPKADTTKE